MNTTPLIASAVAVTGAPLQSRFDPAALRPDKSARAAFGKFCDDIRRLGCLTPTQQLVAWLLARLTLREGFRSLPFLSLSQLTELDARVRPFAGLGKNDLSLAIKGGPRTSRSGEVVLVHGLIHYGIVRVEERAARETGAGKYWLVLVIADSTQWTLPARGWAFSAAEELALAEYHLASRQAFTAQFPELAVEPDLHDARAALSAAGAATVVHNGQSRKEETGEPRVSSGVIAGAQGERLGRDARTTRSECRNAPAREKPREYGERSESQNGPLRLKTQTQKPLTLRLSEVKDLLRSGGENDFITAIRFILTDAVMEQGDGGKWRMKWRNEKLRPSVLRVFESMAEDLENGKQRWHRPGWIAHQRWLEFGGKSKESFLTQ